MIELQVPGARNLKDRRRAVKSLVDRLHARCRVSVAEVEPDAPPQRATLGVSIVHASEGEIERLLAAVRALAEQDGDALLVDWREEILEVSP